MARKKVVTELQITRIEFDGMFPFVLAVVYKKGSTIIDIIREASTIDANLIPLMQDLEGEALSLVYKNDGSTTAYIVVDDTISVDVIVHEACHIVFRLFGIIGSQINEDTEEFFSYLTSHMFRKVYEVVTGFGLAPKMIYDEKDRALLYPSS